MNSLGKKLSTAVICASGEHYVAAYLSAMGLVVALPRSGIPATDLIVTRPTGGRAISLQMKTGTQAHEEYKRKTENNRWLWATGEKAKDLADEFHWYVFVYLNGWPVQSDHHPELFFVPSRIVAPYIQSLVDAKDTWPYFAMLEEEAKQYQGASWLC